MTENVPSQPPVLNQSSNPTLGDATVRAPGVCGELVQGMRDDTYYLVTCPIDFYARVRVRLLEDSSGIVAPEDCPKTRAAVAATLAYLERPNLSAQVSVGNPLPRGKGMGSSSADVSAAIAATGLALGRELTPAEIGRLALSIEPSDGVMFPGIALFDHREGRSVVELGPPPPMEIVALDFGGTVDTLEFNRVDRRALWQSLETETDQALELVRQGIQQGDPALVGQGASISSQANQRVLFKPELDRVTAFANSVGAVGVNVAHSGTIIGVLLDARQRRGLSTYRQAQEAFPEAELVQHFRLLGGGVQRVAEG